ncbi:hypothetical protein BVER_02757 [Candidatus Burkholderia verschuerenii]|uniref:Uncharacterized protein n=1 Tax=Candidatus Burkholderia verschuerenii TaxID=242163 RepID=A0A0L0M2M0_9BURK|nr:hypothetical protein BVER_02757 [Candidatus Burkholderia verschuerenii]
MILTREVRRQRLPRNRCLRRCDGSGHVCPSGLRTLHVCNAASGGQILELSLEGLDLPLQLFGFAAELHAPKFVDLCLELLDLDIAFGKQTTSLDQQGLQEIDIVRKIGAVRHARQFTSVPRGLQNRQRGGATGLSPIDALEKHRQLC